MARLFSELVLSLKDRVSGPARGAAGALDALDRKTRSFNGRIRDSGRLTAEAASSMTRAQSMMVAGARNLIAPVASAFTAQQVVASAADFETALTNIQKKAGATAAQTAKLGEEIKGLATSGELAVPIEEIAAAYERGAAAGIPLNELREFASLSAQAADAFEMSATDVGNAAAGFNKALGVPMKDMERLFDLVNGLADAGIADESGIVDYMDRAGAMSKTFGLSVQETAAFGAALANLKVPAERASTAMNSVLTKLLAPDALSGDAREALHSLVGDFGKFAKSIEKDADGALVGLLKRLKSLDKAKRTGIIAELFGQDHLDVVSQMVEGTAEIERNLKYAAGQDWFGSLDKSYKLKIDDFWSQWQIAKNALAELSINLGSAGMPALKSGLQGAVQLVADLDAGMKTLSLAIDWTAVDGAKKAIGDLGTEIAGLLNIDTSKSTIGEFFKTTAREINAVAQAVAATANGIRGAVAFIRDPSGELRRAAAGNKDVSGPGGYAATIDDAYKRMQSGPPEDASARFGREKRKWESDQKKRRELQPELDQVNADAASTRVKLERQRQNKANAGHRLPLIADAQISRLEERLAELGTKAAALKSQIPADAPMPRPKFPRADAAQDRERTGQADLRDTRGDLGRSTGKADVVPTPRPERTVAAPTSRPEPVRRSAEQRVMDMVRDPSRSVEATLVPQPEPVTIPVQLNTAAIEAELARVEQRITDLSTQALDLNAAAAPGVDGGVVDAMSSMNDQLDALNKRRLELEQQLYAPQASVPAPDIAGPVQAEGARAHAAATLVGEQIKSALSVTAKPTVDNSALQGTLAIAQAINRELGRTSGLARQAAAVAGEARAAHSAGPTFDGLHADIED